MDEQQSAGEIQFQKYFIIGIVVILIAYIGYHIGKSIKIA